VLWRLEAAPARRRHFAGERIRRASDGRGGRIYEVVNVYGAGGRNQTGRSGRPESIPEIEANSLNQWLVRKGGYEKGSVNACCRVRAVPFCSAFLRFPPSVVLLRVVLFHRVREQSVSSP
jgi:hypothetical protein